MPCVIEKTSLKMFAKSRRIGRIQKIFSIFISVLKVSGSLITEALNRMLQKLMLVKEVEAFLQYKLRPANLANDPVKLSNVLWSSHWIWDRDLKEGMIEAIYVREKNYTLQGMSKIDRLDLLSANITLEEMYDALDGSTAEKTSIDRSQL